MRQQEEGKEAGPGDSLESEARLALCAEVVGAPLGLGLGQTRGFKETCSNKILAEADF